MRASPSSRTSTARTHPLTPERAVEIQCLLGSDIQMQLDECVALPASPPKIPQRPCERSLAWAERCQARICATAASDGLRKPGQALFGIVQGGIDADTAARIRRGLGGSWIFQATPSAAWLSASRKQ